ncbi:MAG: SDR family NAD(P)-dependent oxidoreductase, partial [Pseudomonadota bacterium]|nr:SDR family NAD(P)-dependent oxidoreductase [Pseudomonadota bacterium]
MADKVFLVIGAGAGIGGHAAARFARGGYHAVLARRSDQAGLEKLVRAIEEDGGKASGTLLDAAADGTIEELVERVERDIGPI